MNSRQQDILNLTEKYGEITIKDLARMLSVTEMTIHRDLDFLSKERLISKKRGAAVFLENTAKAKLSFYNGEKKEIATDNVILAIGHSARDTFRMLYENKLSMEQGDIRP